LTKPHAAATSPKVAPTVRIRHCNHVARVRRLR
jgi:hypothetical protein